MDSFFDLDDLFGNFGSLNKKLMERIQKQFEETEKAIENGELKGNWDVKKIDEPRMKGYIIRGEFWTDGSLDSFDPIEPLRPRQRKPFPEKPLVTNKEGSEEIREPLTDLFEEDDVIRIFAETPGEEESDIKIDFEKDKIEIKGKKFNKTLTLPTQNIDREKVATKYRNGVLEITIPKKGTEPKIHRL
jgi:HSP20 family molecular chaperone IbpA